jgi:hypothetical protein
LLTIARSYTDLHPVAMTLPWAELSRHRRAVHDRLGGIYRLPVVYRARDVVLSSLNDGARCLEVGAGDRRMKRRINARFPGASYESMDVDPTGDHEYRSLEQIDREYDCIFALEVVEHLALEEILPWLTRLAALLRPGGRLILSTPNIHHPPAYLRDATHRTPLAHDELGGLLEVSGLAVDRIVRVHYAPVMRRFVARYLFGWLFKLLGLDFARQIVAIAVKV